MKSEYLRHEYTWSNHCITGNVLGWGITASSCPKEKSLLREVEKIASASEPDRKGDVMVEELSYSPVCGFMKMTVVPSDSGEDKRKNKKVYLYQPTGDHTELPEVYFAPCGVWKEEKDAEYLAPVKVDSVVQEAEDIFIKMNVYDRLPDFLRVVFCCLFDTSQGLNIVAPSWEAKDFATNARDLMLAIHNILPKSLRKRAGYVSYTEQPVNRETFYFSKYPCGENYLNLDTFPKEDFSADESKLEKYFFYHMAKFFVQKDERYENFLSQAEQYLIQNPHGGNELKKLAWLFYMFCQKTGMAALDKEDLLSGIPELFYWASGEPVLQDVVKTLLSWLHQEDFQPKEKEQYCRVLLEGFTKRTGEVICDELNWMLCNSYTDDIKQFNTLQNLIQEENNIIYARLLVWDTDKEGAWQQEVFENHMNSFEDIKEYLIILGKTRIPSETKDQIIRRGIGLLNQDLFRKKSYEVFDEVIVRLNREDQWADILGDFVRQLEEEAGRFDDVQLETACYVEQLLMKYAPGEAEGILKEEWDRRQGKYFPESMEAETQIVPVKEQYPLENTKEEHQEEEEEKGNFWDSLLVGYPQGFLTGCVMYLCGYSLTIGHWKIAVGMIGMWVLFTLNYYYLTMHKKNQYPFWKNMGMTILEGFVIQFIASLFFAQRIRLIYFVLIGLLALVIQMINIVRESMEKKED